MNKPGQFGYQICCLSNSLLGTNCLKDLLIKGNDLCILRQLWRSNWDGMAEARDILNPQVLISFPFSPASHLSAGEGNGKTRSSILAEESHGQRSLAGYSPWGRKESDVTERLSRHTPPFRSEVSVFYSWSHCRKWTGYWTDELPGWNAQIINNLVVTFVLEITDFFHVPKTRERALQNSSKESFI